MPTNRPVRVWAILGPHRGDNNQVLALAEALELPFEAKLLTYNQLRRLQPALLGSTFKSVERRSRGVLEGDPPDLTISTGHRSVPVVREIRRRSGGRTRLVHLGYPRISPAHFDLVVPTPEYPIPDLPNVMRIPFALSLAHADEGSTTDREQLSKLPHPRRLFVLGGPTLYWELPVRDMLAALEQLLERAACEGGSVLAIGSPRTPRPLLQAVGRRLAAADVPVLMAPREGSPSYRSLLAAADEIFVTADSVAMVADAVNTGKPMGIIPIAKSPLGRVTMAALDRVRPGKRLFPRDLRFFWAALREQGLGGTIESPEASDPPDYIALVANRVRQLLEQPLRRATNVLDSDR